MDVIIEEVLSADMINVSQSLSTVTKVKDQVMDVLSKQTCLIAEKKAKTLKELQETLGVSEANFGEMKAVVRRIAKNKHSPPVNRKRMLHNRINSVEMLNNQLRAIEREKERLCEEYFSSVNQLLERRESIGTQMSTTDTLNTSAGCCKMKMDSMRRDHDGNRSRYLHLRYVVERDPKMTEQQRGRMLQGIDFKLTKLDERFNRDMGDLTMRMLYLEDKGLCKKKSVIEQMAVEIENLEEFRHKCSETTSKLVDDRLVQLREFYKRLKEAYNVLEEKSSKHGDNMLSGEISDVSRRTSASMKSSKSSLCTKSSDNLASASIPEIILSRKNTSSGSTRRSSSKNSPSLRTPVMYSPRLYATPKSPGLPPPGNHVASRSPGMSSQRNCSPARPHGNTSSRTYSSSRPSGMSSNRYSPSMFSSPTLSPKSTASKSKHSSSVSKSSTSRPSLEDVLDDRWRPSDKEYWRKELEGPLTQAMALCAKNHPPDPVRYLALCLMNYKNRPSPEKPNDLERKATARMFRNALKTKMLPAKGSSGTLIKRLNQEPTQGSGKKVKKDYTLDTSSYCNCDQFAIRDELHEHIPKLVLPDASDITSP